MSLYLAGCGDDVLMTEDVGQSFTTVSALDPDDCSDKTEGSMAFVKSTATMYVCTDGDWIALSEEDAIRYRCGSRQLKDRSGFAIVCDGDTIGVFRDGEAGVDGKDGSKGAKGDTGDTGATGSKGAKGDTGDTGATGATGKTGATGAKGDKGDTGATGATGSKGDKGDMGDTGSKGAKGDKGDKGATGASGANGTKGATGDTGANGKSAYEVAKEGGYTGTEQQWLESLKGGKGDTGSSGANGKSAYEIAKEGGYTGTEQQWLESLKGGKGATGDAGASGKSAYEIAKEGGYTGTEQQWLESLKGGTGASGKSAYEIAKEGGYTGTEQQWLESLKGKDADMDKITDDVDNIFSSASGQLDDKFDQAYSSLSDELESRACRVDGDPEKDFDAGTVTVWVQCGSVRTPIVIPMETSDSRVYGKHVVVRFPVQAEKGFGSEQIYEQLWAGFKGGDHAELTVTDLDRNLDATGKMFVTDLFADITDRKDFVTVEETNEKVTEYKVARLEGDLDLTNLSSPLVQLRVRMSLSNSNGFTAFGGNGSTSTTVIYNAIVDLSDGSDTVVIDFLTDYKVERVKKLVRKGEVPFADAVAQANAELAKALALVKDEKASTLPAFEHYLPGSEGIGLNEYFNGIVWVMALIDQRNKVPGFNKVYNDYRKVFAENGDLNTAVETTYAGKRRSLFFVDYLALLINANFFRWNCALDDDGNVRPAMLYSGECETDDYTGGEDDVYYKIIQNGLVSAYKLDTAKAVEVDLYSKVQKSEVEGGYFRYFEYNRSEKVWYPIIDLEQIAFAEAGKCDATAANAKIFAVFTVDNADYSMLCRCEGDKCEYGKVDPCQGREEGHEGLAYFGYNTDASAYKCRTVCRDDDGNLTDDRSGTCDVESYDPSGPSLEDVVPNGKTIDEILNPAGGEGPLGKCTDEISNDATRNRKLYDETDAGLSTTTGHAYYICNGKKWVKEYWEDEALGICNHDMMMLGEVKLLPGTSYYKCDYLDKEDTYAWIGAAVSEMSRGACHYGIAEQRAVNGDGSLGAVSRAGAVSGDGYYVCRTSGTDNDGNHVHDWDDITVAEYCVGDRVTATEQMVEGEILPDNMSYNQKCELRGRPYVRNNPSGDREASDTWVSVEEYVQDAYGSAGPRPVNARRGVARVNSVAALAPLMDGYFVFLNGYRDAAVYWCSMKYQSCSKSSEEDILESWRTDGIAEPEALRILGDLEYGRVAVGTYLDAVKFERTLAKFVENGRVVKRDVKIVASATRTDWHVEGVADAHGECTETVMGSQTAAVTFKNIDYKCDCEKDGDSYKSCGWSEISEKENELKRLCTANILGTFTEDGSIICDNANDGHNWRTLTAEEWCPTHGKNLTGGEKYHGICDDAPGDNTTYLLIGSASSWAQVPDPYRWNEDNISTADKEAVNNQLISGNNCTETDIVNLLNGYVFAGTTDRVNDLVCKNGKLRPAMDEQEACDAAFETTEACKYMEEWYLYEGGSWKKAVCGNQAYDPTDHFCDSREDGSNTVYRMVNIGKGENAQTWMAENLNYETENSWCGGGITTTFEEGDCDVYGRLYTWASAVGKTETECGYRQKCNLGDGNVQGVCPEGWHLPHEEEWAILARNVEPNFVGAWSFQESSAGKFLKSVDWCVNHCEDPFLFSALPAGFRDRDGHFEETGREARFIAYSSTVPDARVPDATIIKLSTNSDGIKQSIEPKDYAFSVRCIKD